VGPVAIGRGLGLLAAAEIDRLGFLGGELQGREGRALVGAVTEGLALAVAAGAPVIDLAGLHGYGIGRFLSDVSLFHRYSSRLTGFSPFASHQWGLANPHPCTFSVARGLGLSIGRIAS